jgi:hypothetical protein
VGRWFACGELPAVGTIVAGTDFPQRAPSFETPVTDEAQKWEERHPHTSPLSATKLGGAALHFFAP